METAPNKKAAPHGNAEAARIQISALAVSQSALPVRNPRERRLLRRLLGGPCDREPLDRAIGASNTPDIVFRLRARGFDIPCESIKGVDRDGVAVRWGRYSLTAADRERIARVVPPLSMGAA